jgi:C-methyltransferase C-terminal domain/Putative zinc binding domain/Methyltransferase domain
MSSSSAIAPDAVISPASDASTVLELPGTLNRCRCCGAGLQHVFVDLGTSPLCESYLTAEQLSEPELFYPLTVFVCEHCLLVQLPTHVSGEQIFSEYAYFSSYSTSYLEHARQNVNAIIDRFRLTAKHFVVELASNDGYLLRNFVEHGIPCLGIEPAANVAKVAQQGGIPTLVRFFGKQIARELVEDGRRADLLVANNVLAHVPDLHDFVEGMKLLLADHGVAVVEVQHLLRLIERNQFDTIYHEHFCYYTVLSFANVLRCHGLQIFDVEEVPTHGGSVRFYIQHLRTGNCDVSSSVQKLLDLERSAGLHELVGYADFGEKVAEVKHRLLEFLIGAKRAGQTVLGYGAPGKGNTLLNYCGIRQDLLEYTVDRNPYKQGRFLPGTRIPIHPPEKIAHTRPDFVLILPWNLRDEIVEQLTFIREWGGKFVVPIPRLEVF